MPYRKKFYFGRRRFRKSRILSSKNIYSNTGAKSQSKQIYALKRKVNKVYRATRPEKKVVTAAAASGYFSSESGGSTFHTYNNLPLEKGTADYQRIGNKVYRKDTWYFTLEYFNNSSTGYHDSESSGVQVRIICGMWKVPHAGGTGAMPSDLITGYASSGAGYTISSIAPLVTNVTETCKIFSDRKFTMTTTRNQKIIKVSTPWYSCRFDDLNHSPSDYWSNHSWVCLMCSGLHWDSNFTEKIEFAETRKTVFTDP